MKLNHFLNLDLALQPSDFKTQHIKKVSGLAFFFADLLHNRHIYHMHQLGDKTWWNTFTDPTQLTGTDDVVTEPYSWVVCQH